LGGASPALAELLDEELGRPAPEAAVRLAAEIRRRHGASVAAVVFYGSCLRNRTREGVLDFYALVDSYAGAYRSRWLRALNAALPPNVFYLELETPEGTLRSKYAVISCADFEAATATGALRPSIWARFCQPAAIVWARDEAARRSVVRAAVASVITALRHGLALLPADGPELRFRWETLWQTTVCETYAAEMRPESPETIAAVFAAAPERYAAVSRLGLDALAAEGTLRWRAGDDGAEVTLPEATRAQIARVWRRRKPLRKLVYLISLIKSATTFGDWLPYALWKLERHTGTRIELSERQRRHPFVWGWPVFWRVLVRRELR
jgi:hypothetical protein